MSKRQDGRALHELRPIKIVFDAFGYAQSSILFEQGDTKILVGVTLQQGVPNFLKGKKTGWLSAEYAMLPHATQQRTQREATQVQRNARSVEISRFIGRCLRPIIDLDALGERSISIDCDVLQADGGTRVASITAASIALKLACHRWLTDGIVDKNIFKKQVVALSLGVINEQVFVDLCYEEDSVADADFNFVLTELLEIVEIQGTSEKKPISWELFELLKQAGMYAIRDIFNQINNLEFPLVVKKKQEVAGKHIHKSSLFSLGNRLK